MCHPPLVCPLCSSAGGFHSPGALWLGLIGVANRLLSCPVCNELLLGLDKLTIHLVSHVPDLNLLASAIGSYVSSNQRFAHDFENSEIRHKKGIPENSILSEKSAQILLPSSEGSSIHYVRSPLHYERFEKSEFKSFETGSPKSNIHKESLSHREQYPHFNIDQDNLKITQCLRKINSESNHTNIRESFTQTSQDLDLDISTDANVKTDNPRLKEGNFPSKNEIHPYMNKLYPQTTGQNSGLNSLIGKDKTVTQNQCTVRETNSISKPSNRGNRILSPDKLYCPKVQARSNPLNENVQDTENLEDNKRSRNVEENITKCDSRTTLFQCIECNAVFDDHRCLFLHYMAFHQGSDPLQSLVCQTNLSESEISFPCQLCNRKLLSKGELLVHMRFAHSVAPETKPENEPEELKEDPVANSTDNQRKTSEFPSSEIRMIKKSCQLNTKINFQGGIEENSTETLQVNEITDYIPENGNTQKDYSAETETVNSLDLSKEEYSNGSPPQQSPADEEVKHSCKICEAQFGSVLELIAHRSAHSEEDGCICVVCSKSFKKEQHLQQHLRTHEGKQWECDVCSKLFTTKYFLKKHKRLHTGEMPYSCETCGKTFTFQQSYHKHLLYHSDEKPHACGECGKRFKELSTLHNHERIHTGEKPFSCESCGKAFRQRVSYLVHRRIHTGVMPYKCTVCDKSFRYKVSQRTHKCSSQQTGTVVRQSSDLVERLLLHQRDKPVTNVQSSLNEVHLFHTEKDNLSNQSGCSSQHSTEALQEAPTSSKVANASDDKNISSFALFSNNFEKFAINLTSTELQNNRNPFSTRDDTIIQDHGSTRKSVLSPTKTELKDRRMRERTADFCSKLRIDESAMNMMDPKINQLDSRKCDTSEQISTSQNSSNSTSPSYLTDTDIKNENNYHLDIKDKGSLEKRNEIKGTSNNTGNEIFNTSLFSSNNDILHPIETDFFTMVMSPAEPTLEQMGKLTISSIPSPPENLKIGVVDTRKTHVDHSTDVILKIDPPVTQNLQNQTNEDDGKNSKCFSQDENLVPPMGHETANASDLSSFLQSCFEHWTSSNVVSVDKPKDIMISQTNNKYDHNLSAADDNQLQTINEESLKNLLYGDHLMN